MVRCAFLGFAPCDLGRVACIHQVPLLQKFMLSLHSLQQDWMTCGPPDVIGLQSRAFSVVAPAAWSTLPLNARQEQKILVSGTCQKLIFTQAVLH